MDFSDSPEEASFREEVRDSLVEQYDVDARSCLADLLSVLAAMRTAELIEVRDAETGE